MSMLESDVEGRETRGSLVDWRWDAAPSSEGAGILEGSAKASVSLESWFMLCSVENDMDLLDMVAWWIVLLCSLCARASRLDGEMDDCPCLVGCLVVEVYRVFISRGQGHTSYSKQCTYSKPPMAWDAVNLSDDLTSFVGY
jgi:hypothetical protein